ncbi:MAG: Bax inhibitor-1/YccA family protein [Gammaproteobacteria bacterium]|nr:Bax inhibitor-1/YccA family protein [Gammaproteobacteria bacterium]MYD75626.1 Bax inhibitor-1/YccA family protein [Gammaproteobacteria bacterium]MYJ53283.1 Bax inhibitor-1/YccA family protein [Gammaproteobacteria bacterium]
MNRYETAIGRSVGRGIEINNVLRNTYMLLSATLLFSAVTAGISMALNFPPMGALITIGGYFLLLFLTSRFQNSALGLVFVFALTGFMGLTLGPILGYYVTQIPNGGQLVATALGGTGVIFAGLSGYVLITRKDFSFIGGMLMAGILVAFLAALVTLIWPMPALSLAISAMFILLMSGLILFQTSQIVHGGETNYISATVTLYVAIYNLFLSLLHIFGIFGGDD